MTPLRGRLICSVYDLRTSTLSCVIPPRPGLFHENRFPYPSPSCPPRRRALVGYLAWNSVDVQMSIHGYIAMILGIVFSLVIGCGQRPHSCLTSSVTSPSSFVETGPEAPVQVPGFCLVVLISPHADAMVTAQHVAADRNCTLGAVGDWSLALHHEQFRERCKINL